MRRSALRCNPRYLPLQQPRAAYGAGYRFTEKEEPLKAEIPFAAVQRLIKELKSGHRQDGPLIGISVRGARATFTVARRAFTAHVTVEGGIADGDAAADASDMLAVLGAITPAKARKNSTLTLIAEPERLLLRCDGEAAMPLHPFTDPVIAGGETVTVTTAGAWAHALAAVIPAARKTPAHDVLAGIRLWRDPHCCLVLDACDTKRLHRQVTGEPEPGRHESRLPTASAAATAKLLGFAGPHEPLTVTFDGETLVQSTATVTVAAHAPARSDWPALQHILEKSIDTGTHCGIETAALRTALQRAERAAGSKGVLELQLIPGDSELRVRPATGSSRSLELPVHVHEPRGDAITMLASASQAVALLQAAPDGQATLHKADGMPLLSLTAGRFHAVLALHRTA